MHGLFLRLHVKFRFNWLFKLQSYGEYLNSSLFVISILIFQKFLFQYNADMMPFLWNYIHLELIWSYVIVTVNIIRLSSSQSIYQCSSYSSTHVVQREREGCFANLYIWNVFLFVLDNYELFHRTNICIANLKIICNYNVACVIRRFSKEWENSPHEIQITIMIINAE